MPQIETPYGRRAIQHLVEIIQAVKAADPLAPVTVAVPSNYAGLSLRRTVGIGAHRLKGAAGEGLVNVRFMVLSRIAEFLGAPALAGRGLAPLTPVVFSELVRQVLLGNPGALREVIAHPSTVLSLVRTFRDLRRATPASVEAIAAKGPRAGHLSALFAAFRERAASRYYDEEDLAAAAAQVVAGGSAALRDIGHVVTFLLDGLTPQEQGFTEALDRRGINQALTLGHSRLSGSIIPTSFEYFWQPPAPTHDPARAKLLLAEAGYPSGFDAGEYFCDTAYANLGEAVTNQLQTVGIRARLRPLERAAFFSGYAEKKFKNIIQGASGAFGNAATRLEAFVAAGGTYVYGGYPDIDGLFREQAAEADPKRREAALHRLQQLVHEKVIYAPIWELAFLNGVGPRVGESGLGLINGHAYSAPYEDITLKGK